MVKAMNISIKEASAMLGINYSTAKTILQLYKRTGRIDRLERKYLLSLGEEFDDQDDELESLPLNIP